MPDVTLTARQREILEYIEQSMRNRGYPPSVREIGEAVGLTSPSTVHTHLATLQRLGLPPPRPHQAPGHRGALRPHLGRPVERRPVRHVPLVGDVAAGTDVLAQENVEEILPLPADFTGEGDLFMLRVRGDSMIDAGILDGDFVVARSQADRRAAATSSWPASPARRPRSRPMPVAATRSSSSRPTRACPRWSSPPTRSRSTAGSSPSCAACNTPGATGRRRHGPVRRRGAVGLVAVALALDAAARRPDRVGPHLRRRPAVGIRPPSARPRRGPAAQPAQGRSSRSSTRASTCTIPS